MSDASIPGAHASSQMDGLGGSWWYEQVFLGRMRRWLRPSRRPRLPTNCCWSRLRRATTPPATTPGSASSPTSSRPATSPRRSRRSARASTGRPVPDAARHHRLGQERHHRLDHRAGAAAHVGPRAQQVARRPAGAGDPRSSSPTTGSSTSSATTTTTSPRRTSPSSDTYIEKDSSVNDEIDRLRHSATSALLTRRDIIVVASVSCIYGLGTPEEYTGPAARPAASASTTTSEHPAPSWSTCSTTATT